MDYTYKVKQGDLLQEENATFIVNASNTRLILGTGVSMAFKAHCGVKLQQEMLEVYQKVEKPIAQGTVFATSSGAATNFKYTLHASVMNYNQGTRYAEKIPTLETIQEILANIEGYLEWYAQKSDNSMKLVLPLMGCGVGGLEKEAVIKAYKTFFEREVTFDCEVVVYGYLEEDYKLITSICSEHTPHNSWSNYYDFVNERSFGDFLKQLTSNTLEVVERLLPEESSIIDFGAGTGRLSVPLAEMGYKVTAVEPSSGMLEILQQKCKTLDVSVTQVETILQDFTGDERVNLGIAVFTVLGYITTEEELDRAFKVLSDSIVTDGHMLLDVASRRLFSSSHIQVEGLDRDVKVVPVSTDQYLYTEVCSGTYNMRDFAYKDVFTICYWEPEYIIQEMQKNGFTLIEKPSEFYYSGAQYLLFRKNGT